MTDGLRLEPIKRTRVHEEVASRIQDLIRDGTLRPGESLPPERELAQRFRVSRTSVRDAIRALETIGLVESRHGEGTFARELSVDNLVAPLASILVFNHRLQDELMDARRMFEPAVARVAAQRATAAELAELERILETQRAKVGAGEPTIDEDTAFHYALACATHNPIVVQLVNAINELLAESRQLTLQEEGRPARSLRGHEEIVAALRRHDPDGVAAAMRAHIDQIAALLAAALPLDPAREKTDERPSPAGG